MPSYLCSSGFSTSIKVTPWPHRPIHATGSPRWYWARPFPSERGRAERDPSTAGSFVCTAFRYPPRETCDQTIRTASVRINTRRHINPAGTRVFDPAQNFRHFAQFSRYAVFRCQIVAAICARCAIAKTSSSDSKNAVSFRALVREVNSAVSAAPPWPAQQFRQ